MKINIDNLEETYKICKSSGKFKEKFKYIELIKSMKDISERGLKFIKDKSKDIIKESEDWTFVFRDYYESLRSLIECYLLFEGMEADNHQCKNAYICFKHSELELDWNFLETIRLKRNSINYKGQLLKYNDWQMFKINFELHLNILQRELNKKITEVENNKEKEEEEID